MTYHFQIPGWACPAMCVLWCLFLIGAYRFVVWYERWYIRRHGGPRQ